MAIKPERRQATQKLAKAVAHPLRSEIFTILTERVASPAELAKELKESVGNVSYHVGRLVELGCAELVDEKPVRGAVEHFYRAITRTLVDIEDWEQLQPAVGEHFAGQAMQKILDDFMRSAEANLLATAARLHLSRTRLLLDEEGRREALEVHEQALSEVLEIQSRSAERMAASGEPGFHISSAQACFEVPARS
jgi:DNA-binding transcriptional ArsR family regulator